MPAIALATTTTRHPARARVNFETYAVQFRAAFATREAAVAHLTRRIGEAARVQNEAEATMLRTLRSRVAGGR